MQMAPRVSTLHQSQLNLTQDAQLCQEAHMRHSRQRSVHRQAGQQCYCHTEPTDSLIEVTVTATSSYRGMARLSWPEWLATNVETELLLTYVEYHQNHDTDAERRVSFVRVVGHLNTAYTSSSSSSSSSPSSSYSFIKSCHMQLNHRQHTTHITITVTSSTIKMALTAWRHKKPDTICNDRRIVWYSRV